jgi:cytochrome c oxidase subunit 2
MLVITLTGLGLTARSSALAEAAPQAPTLPNSATVAQGRALFIAKGCIVCHRHAAVDTERQRFGSQFVQFAIGPDLPTLATDPQLLQAWLKNPPSLKPGTDMPNLKLNQAEIEALTAFLLNRAP